MRLIRQLTTPRLLNRAIASSPVRSLAVVGSLGLVAGWSAFACGAVPAVAAQDQEQEKNVKVEIKKIGSDDGENVEVIVVGEDGVDHKALLKKLKSKHGIDILKLQGDKGENVEVEVLLSDDKDTKQYGVRKRLKKAKNVEIKELQDKHGNIEVFVVDGDGPKNKVNNQVHGHVAEFLLKQGAGNANHHELANQLRAIADQLDGKAHGKHPNVQIHENVEIHHEGEHGVRIHKHGALDKKNNQKFEVITGGNKKLHILKSDKPHEMVLDLTADGNHKLHTAHAAHGRLLLQHAKDLAKEHGKAHEIIVKRMHGKDGHAHDHEAHEHGDHGKTSDESDVSTLEDLRSELEALRNDLKSLRAKRQPQKKKRVQFKKSQSSNSAKSDDSANRFVWVSDDKNEKPENTFVWKTKDGTTKQVGPNRFRIEFDTDEESDDQ